MQDRALDVHMLAVAPAQQPQHEQVHQHADDGDDEHRPGQHRLRIAETVDGFEQDEADDAEQRQRIDQPGDDLEPGIAEGAPAIGGAAAHAVHDPGGWQCGQRQPELVDADRQGGRRRVGRQLLPDQAAQ